MTESKHPFGRRSISSGFALALLCLSACAPTASVERSGAEALRLLPPHLAEVMPPDLVLCHHERSDDATYRLWIVRSASRELLRLPNNLPESQRRRLPASVLGRILSRTAPWLEPGEPEDRMCSFTRWHHGESDYQVREMITPNGWYATVEEFAHGDTSATAS